MKVMPILLIIWYYYLCWHFSYLTFSRFIIFTFTKYFTLFKVVLYIWKIFFFSHHSFMKKSHSKFCKNKPLCMCKEVRCVGLGKERDCLREGGETVWNTLKGGGIEKKGRETKILKRRGAQARSRGGSRKTEELEDPYELWLVGTWNPPGLTVVITGRSLIIYIIYSLWWVIITIIIIIVLIIIIINFIYSLVTKVIKNMYIYNLLITKKKIIIKLN